MENEKNNSLDELENYLNTHNLELDVFDSYNSEKMKFLKNTKLDEYESNFAKNTDENGYILSDDNQWLFNYRFLFDMLHPDVYEHESTNPFPNSIVYYKTADGSIYRIRIMGGQGTGISVYRLSESDNKPDEKCTITLQDAQDYKEMIIPALEARRQEIIDKWNKEHAVKSI